MISTQRIVVVFVATVSLSLACGGNEGPTAPTPQPIPDVGRPTVTISVSPTSASVGEAITVTLLARRATGEVERNARIVWGDGNVTVAPGGGRYGVDTTQRHGYASPGEYQIMATATFDAETVSTEPVRVTIGPQTRLGLVYAYSSGTPSGQMYTFAVFPRRTTNPSAVRIEFGDGTSEALDPLQPTYPFKRYNRGGPYAVRAIQTNADGTTETTSVDIVAICCG
jgi:hypothetical protein